MSEAKRGSGLQDKQTADMLKELRRVRRALVEHVSKSSTKRNMSKKVAIELQREVCDSGIDMGNLGSVAVDVRDWRESQDTAAPGVTPTGRPVRRRRADR